MDKKLPRYFNNLHQLATRPMTVQREEWPGAAFYKIAQMRCVGVPFGKGTRVLYIESDDLKKACAQESEKVMTHNGWEEHLRVYNEGKEEFVSLEKKIAEVKLEPSEISILYKEWLDLLLKWGIFGFFPFALESYIDPKFRQIIGEKFPKEADEIILATSSPSELNDYQKMRLDICDYVLNPTDRDVKNLVNKYDWYNEYSFVESLYGEDFFKSEIDKLTEEKALVEKREIEDGALGNKERFLKVRGLIETDSEAKLLAEIIHAYTFLRTDRIDIYKKGQTKIRKIYDLIAELMSKKTSQKWERIHVVNLLNSEIIDFLDNNILPDKLEIDKRVTGDYLYLIDENGARIISDNLLIVEAQRMIKKDSEQEIKGQIAHKGKVTGKVVIANGKEDLSKVKEGDILVARITMPDYTPAMKVASAFVTEEGGITSHAAIIARELKKPCIVGTGNCTKILKDGDFVEVDAENGVVKIINK